MSWSYLRAKRRIESFAASTPEIRVERFVDEYIPRLRKARVAQILADGRSASEAPPLYDLPDGQAVLVDTVQVYARALSYDDVRAQEGRETERSHARGLSLLHLLYGSADRAIEDAGAQRVDHHGARVHAVIIEPSGDAGLADRIALGLSLAERMIALARAANTTLVAGDQLPLRFRVGIDFGPCVAINSGRSDEREPMFIGPAANHAAKLAEGDEEGIFISDSIRAALRLAQPPVLLGTRSADASELEVLRAGSGTRVSDAGPEFLRRKLDEWAADIREHRAATIGADGFRFHHHTPPLRTIDYAELSPANSIRMDLVSIFADLAGYTAYIDHAMRVGGLREAVRILHILRSEFNAVLQDDFDGRKVRFIGDCIHGLIAAGTARETDLRRSIGLAASCAGALRSSFDIVREQLPEAAGLGLSIGFESGPTPVSRIGIRGSRSVRIASSLATRASQELQSDCTKTETKIGPSAYAAASPEIRLLFGDGLTATDLTYDDVMLQTGASAPALIVSSQGSASNTSHVPFRAHARLARE